VNRTFHTKLEEIAEEPHMSLGNNSLNLSHFQNHNNALDSIVSASLCGNGDMNSIQEGPDSAFSERKK
jgi:hypothetical protein